MEVMFDTVFNNNCSPSVCSAVGILGGIYCVVWNLNVASRGEMRLKNQHNVYILGLYVGFDFRSMLGEPISIP
jgi:hypothetical protein